MSQAWWKESKLGDVLARKVRQESGGKRKRAKYDRKRRKEDKC
jgi:hypothetical protein